MTDFIFNSPSRGRIVVPKGFDTDYASIPRIFWSIYSFDGQWTEAAVVHDWLYWTRPCTRKEADLVFLEGMAELKVPFLRRHLLHKAVRIGGWVAWADNQEKQGYE